MRRERDSLDAIIAERQRLQRDRDRHIFAGGLLAGAMAVFLALVLLTGCSL